MDTQIFDRVVAEAAHLPSRRCALRLLTAGLLYALLPARNARAQRPDRDGDGLFDDDEVGVYGTDPDFPDTDGDGADDGQEIYNRDNGFGGHTDPLVNEDAGAGPTTVCPPGGPGTNCGTYCASLETDKFNCGGCGNVCPGQTECRGGVCALGCYPGQTACGDYCADLTTDHGNCGACGNRCSQLGEGYNCVNGTCTWVCSASGGPCEFGADYQCCGDMICIRGQYGGYCNIHP